MQQLSKNVSSAVNTFLKRLPAQNKLPFFTLSFTLAALIVTIIAVQQQQTLIQNAAQREDCLTEGNSVTIVITEEPVVSISVVSSGTPPRVNRKGTEVPRRNAASNTEVTSAVTDVVTVVTSTEDGTTDTDNSGKKPKKPCKPVRNNDGKNKPTPDKSDRTPADPQKAICKMLPNLSICTGQNTDGGNTQPNNSDCLTNNSGGKKGQENSSNKESTVDIGDINSDETTNTKITVNGKDVTNGSQNSNANGDSENSGDINTGGQVGGNHKTEIVIDKNGTNQTVDKSGSDGNGKNNGGSGDCGNTNNNGGGSGNTNTNTNAGNKNTNKANGKNESSSASRKGPSLLCRFLPGLKSCKDEAVRNDAENKRRDDDDKKKKADEDKKKKKEKEDADNKKKKEEDEKKKKEADKKNVKGVMTDTVLETIKVCIGEDNPTICTIDMRAIADVNGDTEINQTDINVHLSR